MDYDQAKDNFHKMLVLTELGAKWHNDRRQVTFRIFIAYTTLLALAIYQITKLLGVDEVVIPWQIIVVVLTGLCFTYWYYCKWQGTIRIALINDVRRRYFYLIKADIS